MSDNQEIYPKDWPLRRLEDIAFHITSGGTPTSGNARFYSESGQYLFAKTEDLTASKTKYLEHCELKITESALRESSAKIYPVGTILISMYGTIGLTKITRCELAANQALCALMPPFNCDPNYLYQHLEFIRPDWLRFSGQTTQANISGGIVRVREVPLPAISEQKQIAQILDTIDTAIQQTQAIINKLKQLKQGLLHDLLTRGVDAKGELRPCYEDASHLYKESPLGWIPKEWEVRAMEDFLERIIDYRGKTPTKTANGTPLITAKNVRLGYIDSEPHEYISDDSFDRWMTRGIPKKGDVLFTTEAPLGNVAQIDTDSRLAFAQRVIILQTKDELLNTFLKFVLLGQTFRSQLFSLGSGSTVEGIQQSTFRKLKIAIPVLLDEQLNVVKKLTSQDIELDLESERLEKLKKLKTALMDDLLTGRIRVTSLLQTEASSV